jgi:hypothetical protein
MFDSLIDSTVSLAYTNENGGYLPTHGKIKNLLAILIKTFNKEFIRTIKIKLNKDESTNYQFVINTIVLNLDDVLPICEKMNLLKKMYSNNDIKLLKTDDCQFKFSVLNVEDILLNDVYQHIHTYLKKERNSLLESKLFENLKKSIDIVNKSTCEFMIHLPIWQDCGYTIQTISIIEEKEEWYNYKNLTIVVKGNKGNNYTISPETINKIMTMTSMFSVSQMGNLSEIDVRGTTKKLNDYTWSKMNDLSDSEKKRIMPTTPYVRVINTGELIEYQTIDSDKELYVLNGPNEWYMICYRPDIDKKELNILTACLILRGEKGWFMALGSDWHACTATILIGLGFCLPMSATQRQNEITNNDKACGITICVILNKDGKPMLYKEFLDEKIQKKWLTKASEMRIGDKQNSVDPERFEDYLQQVANQTGHNLNLLRNDFKKLTGATDSLLNSLITKMASQMGTLGISGNHCLKILSIHENDVAYGLIHCGTRLVGAKMKEFLQTVGEIINDETNNSLSKLHACINELSKIYALANRRYMMDEALSAIDAKLAPLTNNCMELFANSEMISKLTQDCSEQEKIKCAYTLACGKTHNSAVYVFNDKTGDIIIINTKGAVGLCSGECNCILEHEKVTVVRSILDKGYREMTYEEIRKAYSMPHKYTIPDINTISTGNIIFVKHGGGLLMDKSSLAKMTTYEDMYTRAIGSEGRFMIGPECRKVNPKGFKQNGIDNKVVMSVYLPKCALEFAQHYADNWNQLREFTSFMFSKISPTIIIPLPVKDKEVITITRKKYAKLVSLIESFPYLMVFNINEMKGILELICNRRNPKMNLYKACTSTLQS